MKHIKHFMLTVLVALLSSASAFAYQFEVDGIIYEADNEWSYECKVVGYNGIGGDVIITNNLYRQVTSIGDNAFANCKDIVSVTIPSSVSYIGIGAFVGCINLEEIRLEGNDRYFVENDCLIKDGILILGLNKESIVIPNSVTSIARYSFKNMSDISEITIPESVNWIDSDVIERNSSIKKIIIRNPFPPRSSSGFISLDMRSTCTLYVPNGCIEAYRNATGWNEFENIVEYEVEDSFIFEADGLYYLILSKEEKTCSVIPGYEKYTGDITIPSTVNYNGITYSVTSIRSDAFEFSTNLTSITIGNSVTEIKGYAFQGCTSLTTVRIPSSVTSIDIYAFYDCFSITELILDNPTPIKLSYSFIYSNMPKNCTLYVPKGSLEAYQNADYWKEFENIVEYEQEEEVNEFVVDGIKYSIISKEDKTCSVIAGDEKYCGDVEIPSKVDYNGQTYTVTTISTKAFYNCTELTSISIPRTLTEIEESAFDGCTGLTKVNVEDLVAWCNLKCGEYYIGSYDSWYYNYNPLTYAHNLYLNGELVTDLIIPENITKVKCFAFAGCTSLKSIHFHKNVVEVEPDAFIDCTGLTRVDIDDLSAWFRMSVGYIGSEEMYISNPLQYAHNLYLNGELVTDLEIPSDVSRIRDCAFYGCKSLTSVVIPRSLENIGRYAFCGCTNLKTVYNLSGWRDGSTPIKESWVKVYATNVYTKKYDVYDGKNEVTVKTDESQITKTSANALVFDLATATIPTKENYINYKNQAGKVTLTDAQPFYCPEDVSVESLTYTRTFKNKNWQPLFVPFSMNYDEWKDVAKIAFFNNVQQYDFNQDGIIDKTVIEWITKAKGTINPNTPYLIQPHDTSKPLVLSCQNTTLKATPDTDPYITCASTTIQYKFSGTYQPRTDLRAKGSYVMGGGTFGLIAEGYTLSPFRFYIDITSLGDYIGKTRAGGIFEDLGKLYISIDGELIEVETEEPTTTTNTCFDIQGRKVAEPKSGFYVRNNKLIYIK